ncbi:MAG: hypothetical protein JXJ04_21020, partial [Spirochaetales bacterium]|nr:hypothetical protein [Spirochaetales bacterium]
LLLLMHCNIIKIPPKVTEEEKKQIFTEKGFNLMPETLKPVILKSNTFFMGLHEINKLNSVATVSNGEFCFLTIDKNGFIEVEPILKGFPPPEPAKDRETDFDGKFMWQKEGRGFRVIEIETKKTGYCLASANINAQIHNVMIIDKENKIFLIHLVDYAVKKPPYTFYVLYNFKEDKIIYESPYIRGILYYLNDNKLLWRLGSASGWYMVDIYLNKYEPNELTKKLSALQIFIADYGCKPIHVKQRILYGSNRIDNRPTFFTVRWSEDFEEVKAEPIILQRPKGLLYSSFFFSRDGNWGKTHWIDPPGPIEVPRLLLYHIDDKYPQGLSMPIICGYSGKESPGAFMQHETWGPCYVEQDNKFPDKLFVYKLNEGLELLAKQALNTIGGK